MCACCRIIDGISTEHSTNTTAEECVRPRNVCGKDLCERLTGVADVVGGKFFVYGISEGCSRASWYVSALVVVVPSVG